MLASAVKEAIAEVVRERFPGAPITDVNVAAGEDSDGDPVLRIFVVFDPPKGQETLDVNAMLGLPRLIRGRLEYFDMDAFPLISYVSKKDVAKLNLAAA